tara:strand:- start:677 stop:1192 length:516 start_codon:yes stop_codon:yes gene_type:complete
MILGLDVSTNCTGITVLSDKGELLYCEAVRTHKEKSYMKKLDMLDDKFVELLQRVHIDHIFIEEPVQRFAGGKSSAKTIALLNQFNGAVRWLAYDIYGVEPEFIPVRSARKLCGIKPKKGEDSKKKALEWVEANCDSFKYDLTHAGNPKPGTLDRSDSVIIAKAGFIKLND